MKIRAKFDKRAFDAALDGLNDMQESLARRMALAGARELRDEAQLRAPVGTEEGGSKNPGTLRDSIYVAYDDRRSGVTRYIYSVSWNRIKAPHGHLVEFGHIMSYMYTRDAAGNYWTLKPLVELPGGPIFIKARPFLGPAYDAKIPTLKATMIARGREDFPELLARRRNE